MVKSQMKVTITLYNFIKFELAKMYLDESYQVDDSSLMEKILKYDDDIAEIIDRLFGGRTLNNKYDDLHFKKAFLYRFMNRQINRQTVGSFKMELISTFLTNESFINTVYSDLDQYLAQKQTNKNHNNQKNRQLNEGVTTSDNRSAFADLPQSQANLDVNNTSISYATDNTVSRNKQLNNNESDTITKGLTTGENRSYQLDELFKVNGLLENILDMFDKKCFLQVWG